MKVIFPDGELDNAAELGAITDRSARVWARSAGAAGVAAELRVAGRDPVATTIALSAETDWTGVAELALPEPAPDAAFACVVGGRTLHGRFAPTPGATASVTFGFGSCHRPFTIRDGRIVTRPNAGIYPAMRAELARNDARFLLLVGDQFYADELRSMSVYDDLPGDEEHPPPLDVALAAYRRLCRGFFAERGMRALRESFPTYCMWDDHDIVNNWGSTGPKSPLDRRLFEAADRTYREYQAPRNPAPLPAKPPYPWLMLHGDIAVLALDTRGARDDTTGTMLGAAQLAWAREQLSGAGLRDARTLFIVSSVPVVHVARWFTTMLELAPHRLTSSARDRWSTPDFIASRDALLDALFAWQAVAAARQVIILSGDVHAASAFTVRRRHGPGIMRQFVSSALSTPLVHVQMVFNRLVTRGVGALEPQLRIERHFLSLTNNYGLVRAEPLPGGGHRVRFVARAWTPKTGRLVTAGRLEALPAD